VVVGPGPPPLRVLSLLLRVLSLLLRVLSLLLSALSLPRRTLRPRLDPHLVGNRKEATRRIKGGGEVTRNRPESRAYGQSRDSGAA
jgi:hypothetical protein